MTDGGAAPRYWQTSVSAITPQAVWIRGYNLEELIGLPFSALTFLILRGRVPSQQETKVMDAVMTAVLDYGLEKSGTAAARYVVSTNPSMQAGLAAATLGAGTYGLATEDTCQFIIDTYQAFLASGEADMDAFALRVVNDARTARRRIPGFGHPVFRKVDPRARILRAIAVDNGLWGPAAQLYEAVHQQFVRQPGREDFPINDVAILAAITVALGFTPEESTALAIIGTLPGVAAHISEELAARKPGRVIPPETADYQVPHRDLRADLAAAGW